MKNAILLASLFLSSQTVWAHKGHSHAPKVANCASKECTQQEIEAAVPAAVQKLVESGKIEGSWTSAKIEKVEQKTFKKGPEWVATLLDEKQTDPAKQRLYVFITKRGTLNGANMTGH